MGLLAGATWDAEPISAAARRRGANLSGAAQLRAQHPDFSDELTAIHGEHENEEHGGRKKWQRPVRESRRRSRSVENGKTGDGGDEGGDRRAEKPPAGS